MQSGLDIIVVNDCYPQFEHLQESSLFCEEPDGDTISEIIADEMSLEIQIINYFGPEYVPDLNIFLEGVRDGISRF
jgi:hypothetical protein